MVSVSLRVNCRVRARNIVKLKLLDQCDVTVSIRVDWLFDLVYLDVPHIHVCIIVTTPR